MKKWEWEETEVAFNIIYLTERLAIVNFLNDFYQKVSLHGVLSLESILAVVMFGLFRKMFAYFKVMRSSMAKFWLVFGLYEVGQMLIVCSVVFATEESYTTNLINSTAFLMIGEISPIHSQTFNCGLIAKHIAVWTWAAQYKGVPGTSISLLPAIWCFWNLLNSLAYKRKLLQDKQKAEEEKEVEEKRLKAVLSALPDGLLVISETFEIVTANSAAGQQLELPQFPHPTLPAALVLMVLRYDSEYAHPREEGRSFVSDVRLLLEHKEGVVKDFQPVVYKEKHLECRGCVMLWDGKKVLILTIRDISKLVELEKAAKQDSANKTALLRSVSHELRTPVNAIINLCQDLQSSPTLEDRDRPDVEVISNASVFLLSMINDLLDYSRILHDKFELVKTTFDLEKLIRSCGALIALQCKQKQIELIVRYHPQLPKLAYTDENRLKQVILNLLANAAK